MTYPNISLVVSDVDGTLISPQKEVTPEAMQSIRDLRTAGIKFAIASSRPARGLHMIAEAIQLDTPMAGFNGGRVLAPDFSVIDTKAIPAPVVSGIVPMLQEMGLSIWLYSGNDWYVTDRTGPRVDREEKAVRFPPVVIEHFHAELFEHTIKIVGVCMDFDVVMAAENAVIERFGTEIAATRSQPFYLDITHAGATKGEVVKTLSRHFAIPASEILTIGDMMNDVPMFRESGYSVAMGNAADDVKAAANEVTDTNADNGFAKAMNRLLAARLAGR